MRGKKGKRVKGDRKLMKINAKKERRKKGNGIIVG